MVWFLAPLVTVGVALLRLFMPLKKMAPVFAIVGGVAATIATGGAGAPVLAVQIAQGVVTGLAATGLYEVGKQAAKAAGWIQEKKG